MAEIDDSSIGEAPQGDIHLVLRTRNAGKDDLLPEYSVDRFPFTVGRHPTNDLELALEAISRFHARFEMHSGHPRLIDLASSNGTYVNGERVQAGTLHDQDSISFGGIEFVVAIQSVKAGEQGRAEEDDSISVHFMMGDKSEQLILQAELPEDTGGLTAKLDDENPTPAQLRHARQQLEMLYRLQEVLRSSQDEQRLLRKILDLLMQILPIDRGVVLTRDPDDPSLFRPAAIRTRTESKHNRIGISKTILQRCLKERVAILSRDARADARFDQSESIVAHSLRSILCAPLMSMRTILGFFHLDTAGSVRSFNQEDLNFLATVAAETATHLHNMRMVNEKIAVERMAAIGQTITGMAHNIKNILVLTQGGIDMMEKRLQSKRYDTVEETWDVVKRGLGRINGLTQDMLDYSRARTVERRRVDVNAMLRDLQRTFADTFAKQRIACKLSLDEGAVPLMLDAAGLEKALLNLIVNASEAVPDEHGEIKLRTKVLKEGGVSIIVEDNGCGIPKEVLPRIFIPFFTTKGAKGSGLGLAMTKKFIEDMGGQLEVRSIDGKGAAFRITFHTGQVSPRLSKGE